MQSIEVKNNITKVVAGILIKNKKVLISSRNENKVLSDCWEFPGGKVEKNETNFLALKRELKEEISINLKFSRILFDSYLYDYQNFSIEIFFFLCKKWVGNIKPREGQRVKWVTREEIKGLRLLPSNMKVLKKLFLSLNF